ncbi:MAG: hypothetical protein WAS51_17475 [Ilumatobacteraceae bacterium]|nr:MAG: hypothetical protein IPM43_06650 [Actinomycetota bacterium]
MRRLLAAVMVVLTIGMFNAGTATAAPVTLQYRDAGVVDAFTLAGTRVQTRGSEVGGNLSGKLIFQAIGSGGNPLVQLQWLAVIDYGNGDVLELEGVGTLNLNTGRLNGTETVVGGSGRYAGATGELNVRGRLIDFELRTASTGNLTYGASG